MKNSSAGWPFLIGFFSLSCIFLIMELLVSRAMSAIAFYHFSFMAICVALFGLTVGAVITEKYKQRYLENFYLTISVYTLAFSVTTLLLLYVISHCPIFYNKVTPELQWNIVYDYFNMVCVFVAICLPFVALGTALSLIFTSMAGSINKIYFINMVASASGCLAFIPLMNYIGAFNTFLWLSLIGCLITFLFVLNVASGSFLRKVSLVLCMFIGCILVLNIKYGFMDFQWTKGQKDDIAFYKKWNAFSYLRLVNHGSAVPFGWGFAPKKWPEIRQQSIRQVYLDIDGIAGTTMNRFDGDLNKINFLKYDVTALPHYLVPDADMLVIGVGAGKDILTGLAFKQKKITGVEINQGILYLLNDYLADFSGHLKENPHLRFVNDEARSYIASLDHQVDLIQISLIDTFAASLAGAYTLTENSLYTEEAFTAYLKHIKDKGFLSVSYWYHPDNPQYVLRLTGVAAKALHAVGIERTRDHIVIVHKNGKWDGSGVATILVKKDNFEKREIDIIQKFCDEMGFDLILSPGQAMDESFARMADINEQPGFIKSFKFNVNPSTDDSPFFFLVTRPSLTDFWKSFQSMVFTPEYIPGVLLLAMILLTAALVILPLWIMAAGSSTGIPYVPFSLYFSSIGLAYMFVEVSQMTRLSTFLGHPIYSLAVVLFALLISSGTGSLLLGRIKDLRKLILCFVFFIILTLLFSFFTPALLKNFSRFGIETRLFLSVILIAPLGFFMGGFLPLGIRLLNEHKGPVALMWGLNGAFSVIGSILTMIFLINFGIKFSFNFGVFLYVIAIAIAALWLIPLRAQKT